MNKIISKSFTFEAAHFLEKSVNIKNKNIHGHSFYVEIFLLGNINSNGFIVDFAKIEKSIKTIKEKLDHNFLNDIEGLSNPTLENIGEWLWKHFSKEYANLNQIIIKRKTCGESFSMYK